MSDATIIDKTVRKFNKRVRKINKKSPKIPSWPGLLVSHKETRTKVVLARKLGKQGLGSTPGS